MLFRSADAAGRLGRGEDMGLDRLDVGDPQWFVIREVGLLDATALQRDLIAHDVADAIADGAFNLRADHIRVDRNAAIRRRRNLFDHDTILGAAGDLHHLGHVRAKGFMHRDALAVACGRIAPIGL